MINALHKHALLLTTSEGLQFAVGLDADLRAQLRAHHRGSTRWRSPSRCTEGSAAMVRSEVQPLVGAGRSV